MKRVFYLSDTDSFYFEGKRFEVRMEVEETKKLEEGRSSHLHAFLTKCGLEIPCHWIDEDECKFNDKKVGSLELEIESLHDEHGNVIEHARDCQ